MAIQPLQIIVDEPFRAKPPSAPLPPDPAALRYRDHMPNAFPMDSDLNIACFLRRLGIYTSGQLGEQLRMLTVRRAEYNKVIEKHDQLRFLAFERDFDDIVTQSKSMVKKELAGYPQPLSVKASKARFFRLDLDRVKPDTFTLAGEGLNAFDFLLYAVISHHLQSDTETNRAACGRALARPTAIFTMRELAELTGHRQDERFRKDVEASASRFAEYAKTHTKADFLMTLKVDGDKALARGTCARRGAWVDAEKLTTMTRAARIMLIVLLSSDRSSITFEDLCAAVWGPKTYYSRKKRQVTKALSELTHLWNFAPDKKVLRFERKKAETGYAMGLKYHDLDRMTGFDGKAFEKQGMAIMGKCEKKAKDKSRANFMAAMQLYSIPGLPTTLAPDLVYSFLVRHQYAKDGISVPMWFWKAAITAINAAPPGLFPGSWRERRDRYPT